MSAKIAAIIGLVASIVTTLMLAFICACLYATHRAQERTACYKTRTVECRPHDVVERTVRWLIGPR